MALNAPVAFTLREHRVGAQGTVLCVDTMKLLHMPARRINLATQIHTHGKFDFWADWPDTLTQ